MISKEDFNKVWKDSTKEDILNQFYYEHNNLRQLINNWNELEEWLKDLFEKGYDIKLVLDKMKEIKERKNESKKD